MYCFKICVAGIFVSVRARYALTERICRPYMTDDVRSDLALFVTTADIEKKRRSLPIGLDEEQAECICLHEKLALSLLPFDAFVLHAALLEYRGRGYAIVAPRGVGKSTHAKLWMDTFGKDVRVINGDKPIVRLGKDGRFYAYGTPWCGKEGWGENAVVPLSAICLLERGEHDAVRALSEREYLEGVIGQVVFPAARSTMSQSARLLAGMIRRVPAIAAKCTVNEQAARTVCRALVSKGDSNG
ncbi:MAG: hypothetical protein J6R04_07875 [Clostridia bacterium]|nr:hypothetical protein [Clostridia bacterium]